MLDLVRQCIDERLDPALRDRLDSRKVVYVDASKGVVDGWCFLLFGHEGESPIVVAKGARTPRGREFFEAEYGNLTLLDRIGMNEDGPTTPLPLGYQDTGDALVTLQSALRGTVLKNIPGRELFSPTRRERSFDLVLRWWERLQDRYGSHRVVLDDETYANRIVRPVERYLGRFLVEDDEREYLIDRCLVRRPLAGLELPMMPRHADFCTANMALDGDSYGVFDWEFALQPELPLFDLFFFFSSLRYPFAGYRGESSHLDSFVAVFWGKDDFHDAVRARLRAECGRYGIPYDAMGDLLLSALIDVGNLKYDSLLETRGLEGETPLPPDAPNDAKAERWSLFDSPDKRAPFGHIQDGSLHQLRQFIRNGPPDLS